MKEKAPENFRVDYAVSREQKNDKGEKMYIQTRMAQYAEDKHRDVVPINQAYIEEIHATITIKRELS